MSALSAFQDPRKVSIEFLPIDVYDTKQDIPAAPGPPRKVYPEGHSDGCSETNHQRTKETI